MGLFKKATIKAVTKKRVWELFKLIALEPETNVLDLLKSYVEKLEGKGSNIIDVETVPNSLTLFILIVMQRVRVELSYDPSMGRREDYELIKETINKEVEISYLSSATESVLRKRLEELVGITESR